MYLFPYFQAEAEAALNEKLIEMADANTQALVDARFWLEYLTFYYLENRSMSLAITSQGEHGVQHSGRARAGVLRPVLRSRDRGFQRGGGKVSVLRAVLLRKCLFSTFILFSMFNSLLVYSNVQKDPEFFLKK